MRFPHLWATWKVFGLALLWPSLILGLTLWRDAANLETISQPGATGISIFIVDTPWPAWLYATAWVPVAGLVAWRFLRPPSPKAIDAG